VADEAELLRQLAVLKEGMVAALQALTEPDPSLAIYHAAKIIDETLTELREEPLRPLGEIAAEAITPEAVIAGVEVVREPPADGVHTIPVPEGWSIEQAWETINRGEGMPVDGGVRWANVKVEGGRLTTIYKPE
jgi:hypothetical protein